MDALCNDRLHCVTGSPEGPWNHTARLEWIFSQSLTELRFVALVDPNFSRTAERIEEERSSDDATVRSAWDSTKACSTIAEAATLSQDVDMMILGCPPHFRGTFQHGKRADLEMLEYFPHAKTYLVEKPVAAVNPFVSKDCDEVVSRFAAAPGAVSVGYILRYNKAILKVCSILKENDMRQRAILYGLRIRQKARLVEQVTILWTCSRTSHTLRRSHPILSWRQQRCFAGHCSRSYCPARRTRWLFNEAGF